MIDIRKSQKYQEQLDNANISEVDWKKLYGKTMLITGATGMVGSFLVDLILHKNTTLQQHEVVRLIIVTRNAKKAKERFQFPQLMEYLTIVESDVSSCKDKLEKYSIDYMIAGAGNADPANFAQFPVDTIKGNYEGTASLLELMCNRSNCRMIYLSTGEIYGTASTDMTAFKEEESYYVNPMEARSCYPCSKRLAENLCIAYNRQYDVDVRIGRLCYIYGPTFRETDSRSVVQFLMKAAKGENIVLKSKGEQVRSYCYVADAASAILFLLLHGEVAEAYNISGADSDLSIKEFAEILSEIAKVKCVFDLPTEEEKRGYSRVSRAVQNSMKINQLGWHPKYQIQRGLEETMQILRQVERK